MQIRDRVVELRRVRAGDLRPSPRNWRTHPEAQRNALQGLLADVGYADALLARETDDGGLELVDGHLRAETTPDAEVPVLVLDLDEDEAAKVLATLDPLAGMAEMDPEKLSALLADVTTDNEAVASMLAELGGSVEAVLGEVEVEEPEVPEPPDDPITQPGDLWVLGEHRLVCGDCRDAEIMARLMDGAKADLYLTDPPYGVSYVGKTKDSLTIDNDALEGEDFLAFLVEAFTAADRVMHPGAPYYIWHADSEGFTFRSAVASVDWELRQCLVWSKNVMVMGRQDYHWQHEPCLYGWKGGAAHRWYGGRKHTTLLEFDRPSRSESHPTMKPVALFAYLVGNSSKRGDVVLDGFLGAGATLLACEQLQRRCYGTELSPAYCDVIVQRWEELTSKKAKRVSATNAGDEETPPDASEGGGEG